MAKGKFQGMGGMGNMNNMIRQAQKMQQNMEKLQEDLESREYEATSGGGAVTVKVSGSKEVTSIKISPDACDPDDVEMLEDLVMVAVNDAMKKAEQASVSEMSKITGGLNIPGLF
jgi:DNA-binding YbaB/EbfC family protein